MKFLILFVPPYWEKLYPLGAAYLSAVLKQNNIEYDFIDLNILYYLNSTTNHKIVWKDVNFQNSKKSFDIIINNSLLKEYLEKIVLKNYTHISFSTYSSNFNVSYFIAEEIKKIFNGIKIIFGGPEILYKFINDKTFYQNYPVVDTFVIGEGEEPLKEIIKGTKEKIIKFKEIQNLDYLPFPEYNKELLKLYPRKRALPLLFSRGCINNCKFCAEKFLYKKVRVRSAENVIDEIMYQQKNHNTLWFTFYDSMINTDKNELFKFCDIIIEKKIKIKWDCQFYLKNYSIDLLKLMKNAGCFNLFVGLESGSNSVLKRMNKKFDTHAAEKFFKDCYLAGLHFEISLILNYDNETEKEFEETIRFIIKNKKYIPKIAQINNYKHLPGTPVSDFSSDIKIQSLIEVLKKNKFKFTNEFIKNID